MRLNRQRLLLLLLAILLIISSWLGLAAARSGLVVRSPLAGGVPLLYLAPKQEQAVPGVLVAHGFAGSKQLMLGYGYVLAHAGYAVMLWDFDGHGANPTPLRRNPLLQNLNVALQVLLEQAEVDRTRLALLGHSMGSGVVMEAGVDDPTRYAAAIAVSPTGARVTQQVPRNLQLQAGDWEGQFIANAQRLLAQAGGANANLAQGKGRELVVVPNVEHIMILFSDVSHQAARRWLDTIFNLSHDSSYVDRRLGWYGLHLLSWLLVLAALSSSNRQRTIAANTKPLRRWLGLGIAPLVAVAGLMLLSQRVELQALGGIQVGGAMGVWFFGAGLTWLGILAHLPRLKLRALGLGFILFGLLSIAFGVMAQAVWLQWWLIPARLKLWLPLAIACLPWFLASGLVQQDLRISQRVLWWLGQSIVLIGGFGLTLSLLPQLSFIFLLLPLFPLLMAILSLVAGLVNNVWGYAIACALFWGWILAAAFPLSA